MTARIRCRAMTEAVTHEQGKEPIPQTVEALQQVMARDAETMLEMRREIGELRSKLNRTQHKNMTLWKRIAEMEKANA